MLPYRGAILHQWNSDGIPLANSTGARPAGGIPCVGMILGRIWDDSGSILGRFCTDVGSISGSISGPFEAPGFEAPGYEAPGYLGMVALSTCGSKPIFPLLRNHMPRTRKRVFAEPEAKLSYPPPNCAAISMALSANAALYHHAFQHRCKPKWL